MGPTRTAPAVFTDVVPSSFAPGGMRSRLSTRLDKLLVNVGQRRPTPVTEQPLRVT